jgi:hypothetical protein
LIYDFFFFYISGQYAKRVNAKELAVTHFGGEISANVDKKMYAEVLKSVKKNFGKTPIIARDFLSLQVDRSRVILAGAEQRSSAEEEPIFSDED